MERWRRVGGRGGASADARAMVDGFGVDGEIKIQNENKNWVYFRRKKNILEFLKGVIEEKKKV